MHPVEVATLRGKARTRLLRDKAVSFGARFFYCALDDLAYSRGQTGVFKQAELEKIFGCPGRTMRRWIDELAKYIYETRGQYGCVYRLAWVGPSPADSEQSRSAKMSDLPDSDRPKKQSRSAKMSDLAVQDTPGLTPKHSKSSKGGRVNTEPPEIPEKRPPARSFSRIEELAEGLRGLKYQPDRRLLEILMKSVPEECPIAAPVSLVRKRINRRHSKPLLQCMLPVFFREDVPGKWREEAAILESHNAEQARVAEVDRKQEAADRIEARGILERGETDPIERDWAIAILEMQGVGWTATA